MLAAPGRKVAFLATVVVFGFAASACGSVTDDDVVARVNDVELSRDEFAVLVDDRKASSGVAVDEQSEPDAARVDGELARAIAGQFVILELVRSDLEALGIDAPEVSSDATGAERFDLEYNAVGEAWSTAPPETLADDRLREWYMLGPTESGVACAQHILVPTEAEADAVVDRLAAGESFADVAATTSIDAQSSAQAGAIGCQPTDIFGENLVPEFVDGALSAEVGVVTAPVQSEFGYHVIRMMPFDDLAGDDLIHARLIALAEWNDVETDPEIGVWSFPSVTPLG